MKKKRKWLLVLVLILAAAILAPAVFRLYFVLKGKPKLVDTEEVKKEAAEKGPLYDAIVVLGCGVYADGSLSPLLTYRMEKTLELYQAGVSDYIFVTGDHRLGEYDEPDHMAEWLIARGVPKSALIMDYTGYSTYESLLHVSHTGGEEEEELRNILIVTQEYHEYRALYIGEKMGLMCHGAAAKDWPMSPGTLMRHLREIPACLKDWLQFRGMKIRV